MEDTSRTQQDKQTKQINWHDYNYPPLLGLMHFRPSQIKQDRRSLVVMVFTIHIIVLINTILNIIDNCIQGGLNILYAFLFFFMFNPIILFLFYRVHMGLNKQKSKLGLYIYIQPLVIIIEIVISIVDFLGFNGFIKVSNLFNNNQAVAGIIALITSIVYLLVAVWSSYLYFRIFKQRSILTQALL